ncbi:MAG: hypothetical protein BWY47_01448 [Bacteroidetes bacterium ADurb.Bin302]|nr:MAG: hypothetical protein BWY47_01448 [Bacteroidetes bacterium ADurb.Bin302]
MKLNLSHTLKITFLILLILGISLQSVVICANGQYSPRYSLNVQVNNYAGGTTSLTGTTYYDPGVSVQITANPNAGYVFNGWYLNGVFQNKLSTITITMLQNNVLSASFSQQTMSLQLTVDPIVGGTTNPPVGTLFFAAGNTVEVTATPTSGYFFNGWYLNGAFVGTNDRLLVTMDGNKQLVAYFGTSPVTPPPSPSPSLSPSSSLSPSPSPSTSSSPTPTPSSSPTPTPLPTAAPVVLPPATLDVSVDSSSAYSGLSTKIGGKLSANGMGLPNTGILLYLSISGGASWDVLSFVNTDSDGKFTVSWQPSVTGNYLLNATWLGNSEYSMTSKIVNFALTAYKEESVFSVTSNSTLSGLVFDSENKLLRFTVSGPSGTNGYVNVVIPKSLLANIANLDVLLDGNQLQHSYVSQEDSWIVFCTYSHSTHDVYIRLDSVSTIPFASPSPSSLLTSSPSSLLTSSPSSLLTSSPSPSNENNISSMLPNILLGIIIVVAVVAVVFFLLKQR